jgi:hypothetical protein
MPLLVALLVGCLVALVLGLYARLHHPTGFALDIVGFSSALYAKAWLTTFATAFAVVQVVTGPRLGKQNAASWIAPLHRSSGRIAVLLTVPVVVHCIFALGSRPTRLECSYIRCSAASSTAHSWPRC